MDDIIGQMARKAMLEMHEKGIELSYEEARFPFEMFFRKMLKIVQRALPNDEWVKTWGPEEIIEMLKAGPEDKRTRLVDYALREAWKEMNEK